MVPGGNHLPVLFVALLDQLFRAYDESSFPDAMICRADARYSREPRKQSLPPALHALLRRNSNEGGPLAPKPRAKAGLLICDLTDRRFCDSKSRTVRPFPRLVASLQPNA